MGRRLFRSPIASPCIGAADRLGSWPAGRLCTLTYHRITDQTDDGRHPGLISATPQAFQLQLEFLLEHFTIVSLDSVLAAVQGQEPLPDRAVHLTFDDAVDDFAEYALPALTRCGVPSSLFVPTAFVDKAETWFWWDAVHAAVMSTQRATLPEAPIGPLPLGSTKARRLAFDRLRSYFKGISWSRVAGEVEELAKALEVSPPAANVMSWSALEEAMKAGVSVCPHTRTHPHLDQVDLDEAQREIAGSLDDLRDHLGIVPRAFAYPSGQWTPGVRDLVADLGFEVAFTTRRRAHHVDVDDPLLIGRINVSHRTGLNAVRLQLHPWADQFQAAGSLAKSRPTVGPVS